MAVRGAWLLAAALLFMPAARSSAQAPAKFRASGSPAMMARYIVTLSDEAATEDVGAVAKELTTIYGGRLEPYARLGFRGFAVVTTPSRARLMSEDARVALVEESGVVVGGTATPAPPPPAPATAAAPPAVRPPETDGTPASWSSGTYAYDSSGDIRAIGSDTYIYDTVRRLVSGTADKQRTGLENRQDYGYDGFGNRISTTTTTSLPCAGGTDCAVSPGIDGTNNRVSGYQYDDAGNVIQAGPTYTYAYDATGAMTKETFPGGSWQFIYGPDGNRLATYGGGSWQWTLRNQNGTILREYTSSDAGGSYGTASWRWTKDYIYRGNDLLASEAPTGRSHFHLDHLGTPRLITGDSGETIAYHTYYPFGAELELMPRESIEEHLKFTGHERDTIAGDVHTLDYMRARYASPFLGSFFSIDPVNGDPTKPQTWNRYVYVQDNPMLLSDFTGMNSEQKGGCTQGTAGTICAAVAVQQQQKKNPPPPPPPPQQPDKGFTVSTGFQATGNVGIVQGSVSLTGNFDMHGNMDAQVTVGGGGSTGVTSASFGPVVQVTNAGTVSNLTQRGSASGISGGELGHAGIDYINGPRSDGSKYNGVAVTVGVGGGVAPVEVHHLKTYTWTFSEVMTNAKNAAVNFVREVKQTYINWDNAARNTIISGYPQQ